MLTRLSVFVQVAENLWNQTALFLSVMIEDWVIMTEVTVIDLQAIPLHLSLNDGKQWHSPRCQNHSIVAHQKYKFDIMRATLIWCRHRFSYIMVCSIVHHSAMQCNVKHFFTEHTELYCMHRNVSSSLVHPERNADKTFSVALSCVQIRSGKAEGWSGT